MYDYVDGKADWMAYGLPVEGDDGPFLGDRLVPVATCDVTARVADARRALDASDADGLVLVDAGGLAVGEVDRAALEGAADDVELLDVLAPVPTTVRPSVTVAALAEGGGGERLVTTSDGRLLGRASVQAQGAGGGEVDQDRFEAEMDEVLHAVEERFGGREPSPEELRGFLHERLVAEGRSAEDADRFLDQLDAGGSE